MKRISTCNVPEDENNLVQSRLVGEIWASDVIMYKPLFPTGGEDHKWVLISSLSAAASLQ